MYFILKFRDIILDCRIFTSLCTVKFQVGLRHGGVWSNEKDTRRYGGQGEHIHNNKS